MPLQSNSAQVAHHPSRAASNNLNASGISQPAASLQLKENDTGLPDNLKTGVEALSGFPLERAAGLMGSKALQMYREPYGATNQLKKFVLNGTPVAQLVELQAGRLNVVGEHHDESDNKETRRREKERQMCAELVPGGYWMEEEFKISAGGREISADPQIFKFQSEIHFFIKVSEILAKLDSNKDRGKIVAIAQSLNDEERLKLISKIEDNWRQAKGVPYPGNYDDPGRLAGRDEKFQACFDLFQTFKNASAALAVLDPYSGAHNESIRDSHAALVLARNKLIEVLISDNVLHVARSKSMHIAAQQKFETAGVWKVGEKHVAEIQSIPPEPTPRRYNLVPREDFNGRYNAIFGRANEDEKKTPSPAVPVSTPPAAAVSSPAVPAPASEATSGNEQAL